MFPVLGTAELTAVAESKTREGDKPQTGPALGCSGGHLGRKWQPRSGNCFSVNMKRCYLDFHTS